MMRTFGRLALASSVSAAIAVAGCHNDPPPVVPTTGDVGAMTPPTQVSTTPVAPADPPPVTDGAFTEARVHGVHVLVKRLPAAESVATRIAIHGGVRNWTAADAGIEELALATAVAGGTESMPKDAFTQRLSDLGTSLNASSTDDYGAFQEWSVTAAWDESFHMAVDAFRHPALPAAELEIVRQGMIAQLQGIEDSPEAKATFALHDAMYRGHPYANRSIGRLDSVRALTAAQVRAHLDTLREASRLEVIVVGNVDPAHVIAEVGAAFGDLPRGSYQDTPLPPLAFDHNTLAVIEQKVPTNYVFVRAVGPSWRDPDFIAARVMMNALWNREFKEIRTKRNLSYAPGASMDAGSTIPTIGVSVSAVDPITTVPILMGEVKKLRDEPMPADELASAKATVVTSRTMDEETPDGQADRLLTAQLVGGDWHLANGLVERVRAVTAEQIQASARAHFQHVQAIMLGDPAKIDRKVIEGFGN